MGSRVARLLEADGHEVLAASRATGVDAYTGQGLGEAFAGADIIVDCLGAASRGAKACIDFHVTTAGNIIRAARAAGVNRLLCLSIINAREPSVNRFMGYYQGKAAQERAYLLSPLHVTILRTTQWHDFARRFSRTMRVGRWAFVPRMQSQPVAPDVVARLMRDTVEAADTSPRIVELAGPEARDMAELARILLSGEEPAVRVVGIPGLGLKVFSGGLLPPVGVPLDSETFDQWLEGGRRA
ncbi:uncharacterized protein YbjT (DUF2867 family) [Paeniglutamicibacter cryotolerans]|uniref:Uncharacterized protein YbjT (DUF2867 family) n=2 Tax=Paeniglutamicibacter cryotolerans TaxID=670079 RepID=A0A839QMR8_9MICC|nr:uncharacterized protein YbjT (DUF2867 family) [Paeniglutamicibacter cryotolerans]